MLRILDLLQLHKITLTRPRAKPMCERVQAESYRRPVARPVRHRIFILLEVLLRQLINMCVGTLLCNVHNSPADRQVTIRVLRIDKVQSNARIEPHISCPDAPFRVDGEKYL